MRPPTDDKATPTAPSELVDSDLTVESTGCRKNVEVSTFVALMDRLSAIYHSPKNVTWKSCRRVRNVSHTPRERMMKHRLLNWRNRSVELALPYMNWKTEPRRATDRSRIHLCRQTTTMSKLLYKITEENAMLTYYPHWTKNITGR